MRRALVLLPVMLVAMAGCGDDDDRVDVQRPAEAIPCPTERALLPGGDTTTPTPAAPKLDARDLLGLTVDDASARAQDAGCSVRVLRRDGDDLPGTLDLRHNRVNVEERDGRVVGILNVG
ncbi:MAG: hypothetical protein M0P31_05940 [Solirubrobacteraceae bacterium]|nr:hypothetical protein [Solirubrobacteraceae bacterium]